MVSSILPERPRVPFPESAPLELVVSREPLAAIREILSISIHDVVNDGHLKRVVAGFYRITRRVEAESWLRRRIEDDKARAWILAHL